MKCRALAVFVFILAVQTGYGQVNADDIVGVWLTGGKEPSKIQIFKSGEKYYGVIRWLKNPTDNGKAKVDTKNPDESRRNQPIVGKIILTSFEFDGDDEWDDGKIYDPESGKTYSCTITLKNKNTMKVRGYVGILLFGRTETWTRSSL